MPPGSLNVARQTDVQQLRVGGKVSNMARVEAAADQAKQEVGADT